MTTLKVACPRCGQKVSGDESFCGTTVSCPVCTSAIPFPGKKGEEMEAAGLRRPVPPEPSSGVATAGRRDPGLPLAPGGEVPPQAAARRWEEGPLAGPPRAGNRSGGGEAVPSPLFAVISLVSAILGVVTCVGGVVFAPMAIGFGHTALARGKDSPVQPAPGQTVAMLGLVVGYVSLGFTILVLGAMVLFGEPLADLVRGWLQSGGGE